MGWYDFYNLLKKYSGDLDKATKEELSFCWRANPDDPLKAREIAEKKWREENNT